MILGFDLSDLPGDAIGVLILLLISFFGWLKNRFSKPEEEPEYLDEDEERMREIVWRRQVGEADERAPWETDPTVWHPETASPPPLPVEPAEAAPPPAIPQAVPFEATSVPELSEKEKRLAESFEHLSTGRRRSRPRSPLGRALRRPGAPRQAILLSEVLGPPVSLRGPDERHP